jgi:hypothetical protein
MADERATTTIYMPLLDEGVAVWRPIAAFDCGPGIYEVPPMTAGQAETETWAFLPGSKVVCDLRELSDGPVVVAVRIADA